MYGKSLKQLKVGFIVCFILGAAMGLFALIMNLGNFSLLMLIIMALLTIILFPFEIMAFFLNGKNIFKGLIAPIPVLSFILEYFKGLGRAFVAFVWMLKAMIKGEQQ